MSNRKYITYLIVFIIGWFAGSFFVLTHFLNQNDIRGAFSQNKMQLNQNIRGGFPNLRKQDIFFSNKTNTIVINKSNKSQIENNISIIKLAEYLPYFTLPNFPIIVHNNNKNKYSQRIYLDWPVDVKLFTDDNYLALESMLAFYPKAIYRILVPSSDDEISTNKIKNIFAQYQFEKYHKLGYDGNVTFFKFVYL